MYTNVVKDSKFRMSLSSDNVILIQTLEIVKMLDNKDIASQIRIITGYTERQLRKVEQLIREGGAETSVKDDMLTLDIYLKVLEAFTEHLWRQLVIWEPN